MARGWYYHGRDVVMPRRCHGHDHAHTCVPGVAAEEPPEPRSRLLFPVGSPQVRTRIVPPGSATWHMHGTCMARAWHVHDMCMRMCMCSMCMCSMCMCSMCMCMACAWLQLHLSLHLRLHAYACAYTLTPTRLTMVGPPCSMARGASSAPHLPRRTSPPLQIGSPHRQSRHSWRRLRCL